MADLAPTQELTRQELDIINRALDLYYMSPAVVSDADETEVIVLKEKFAKVRFSDFSVCNLETLI